MPRSILADTGPIVALIIVELGNAATESCPVMQIRVERLLFKHDGLWLLPLPVRP